jgi:hypothetical protein
MAKTAGRTLVLPNGKLVFKRPTLTPASCAEIAALFAALGELGDSVSRQRIPTSMGS